MSTLKLKMHPKLLVRNPKIFKIWILIFRVPKNSISGLPYLRRGWVEDFKIYIFLATNIQKLVRNICF